MGAIQVRKDSDVVGWQLPDDSSSPLEGLRWRYSNRSHFWRPPTDIYETDEVIVIRSEVAGMKEADFSILLDNRMLYIQGTRADTNERRAYHQMEIPFGEFSIEIELPVSIDMERVEAVYRDGFLKISMPKMRSHQIKIRGD